MLEADVFVRKLGVEGAQSEVGVGIGIEAIDACRHIVGPCEPHAPLIAIELHEESDADDFERHKKKEVVVATQKVEEDLHIKDESVSGLTEWLNFKVYGFRPPLL